MGVQIWLDDTRVITIEELLELFPNSTFVREVKRLSDENVRLRQLLLDIYDNSDQEDDDIFNFKVWLEAVAIELEIHEGVNALEKGEDDAPP